MVTVKVLGCKIHIYAPAPHHLLRDFGEELRLHLLGDLGDAPGLLDLDFGIDDLGENSPLGVLVRFDEGDVELLKLTPSPPITTVTYSTGSAKSLPRMNVCR